MRRPGEPDHETGAFGERIFRLRVEHRRGLGALGVAREYLSFAVLASARLYALGRRPRYAVVQVHNPPDFSYSQRSRVGFKGAGSFDVHDLGPDMFSMRFGGRSWSGAAERALELCERLALRIADEVVTVHEPYARELGARGAGPERLTVVMNSVDPALLPSRRPRRKPGFRLVYHGTVTASYGLEVVPDAVAIARGEVPELRFEVYGEGDALTALRDQAAQLGLSDCVSFHDRYLPQDEVLARVAGAHAGVIPNKPSPLNRYALSSKLLEYVSLGVPAVVARLPHWKSTSQSTRSSSHGRQRAGPGTGARRGGERRRGGPAAPGLRSGVPGLMAGRRTLAATSTCSTG